MIKQDFEFKQLIDCNVQVRVEFRVYVITYVRVSLQIMPSIIVNCCVVSSTGGNGLLWVGVKILVVEKRRKKGERRWWLGQTKVGSCCCWFGSEKEGVRRSPSLAGQ